MTHQAYVPAGSPAAPPPGRRAQRIVLGAVAAVLLVGAFLWLFWPGIQWRIWIRGAEKEEYYKYLLAEQDPALVDLVADGVRNEDLGPRTRLALARILSKKSRGSVLDGLLRDGDLSTRTIVLQAVRSEEYFVTHFVDDPSFRIPETVLEWLARKGDATRVDAIELALRPALRKPEALPLIRGMLVEAGPAAAGTRGMAAGAVAALEDCVSAPVVLEMARSDPEPVTRLRAVQAAAQLFDARGSPCAQGLTEDAVRGVVVKALRQQGADAGNRALRMGALLLIAKHPQWLGAEADAVRGVLANPDAAGPERRTAMGALVASADRETLAGFTRWFHDPSADLRSEAVHMAAAPAGVEGKNLESCLVGIVRDERESDAAFATALQKVRALAGSWTAVGFPAKYAKPTADARDLNAFIGNLFRAGEAEGATRESVSGSMFRWLAGKRGLSSEETAAAVEARAAFWAKARAGDAAAARAVLDALAGKTADAELWTYERGWLLARS